MFMPKGELMAEALKCVLGESPIPQKKEGNEELMKILTAAGIAMVDNKTGKIVVFNSKNMLEKEGTMFLSEEQVKEWNELNFSMKFQLRGRGRTKMDVMVEKLPGDNYATVADSHGNHIFGAVVALQDSRSPWLLFDGDTRRFSLQFTNKQMPNDKGVCSICTGWSKQKTGERSCYVYDGNFEVWSCTKICRKILADYFGQVFEHMTSDLNNSERVAFIRASDGVFTTEVDGKIVEITKEMNTNVGDILVSAEKVGTVEVGRAVKSTGIFKAQISLCVEMSAEERVKVQNAVWSMLCPMGRSVYTTEDENTGNGIQIPQESKGFKKSKKFHKGKKQFAVHA